MNPGEHAGDVLHSVSSLQHADGSPAFVWCHSRHRLVLWCWGRKQPYLDFFYTHLHQTLCSWILHICSVSSAFHDDTICTWIWPQLTTQWLFANGKVKMQPLTERAITPSVTKRSKRLFRDQNIKGLVAPRHILKFVLNLRGLSRRFSKYCNILERPCRVSFRKDCTYRQWLQTY